MQLLVAFLRCRPDADHSTKRHVALKCLTADSFGHGKDTFELDILMHLKAHTVSCPGTAHILGLLDHFEHRGPNGNHVCLVFKAMGPDLSRFRRLLPSMRLPPSLVKRISKQLLLGLFYLHETCRVIHTSEYGGMQALLTFGVAPVHLDL